MSKPRILVDHGVCWRDTHGRVSRRREGTTLSDLLPFDLFTDSGWTPCSVPGGAPYAECPDPSAPEPRPLDARTRRWMRETGRTLRDVDTEDLYRWNESEQIFEVKARAKAFLTWVISGMKFSFVTAVVPADGDPWGDE